MSDLQVVQLREKAEKPRQIFEALFSEVEARYLLEVLVECEEALKFVRENTIYYKEADGHLARIAEVHKGTVVEQAAKVQLKVRSALRRFK